MAAWTIDIIDRIAATDDLHVAPYRADGSGSTGSDSSPVT